MTGALWYAINSTLHNDPNIPTVKTNMYGFLTKGMPVHNILIIAKSLKLH